MMKDVILICVIGAAIAISFYIIKKADIFLEQITEAGGKKKISEKTAFSIGLSNPMAAGNVADILEKICQVHPEAQVQIYAGTPERILYFLKQGKIDVGILPQGQYPMPKENFDMAEALFEQGNIRSEQVNIPIVPIDTEQLTQTIIWKKEASDSLGKEFAEQAFSGK